MASRIGTYREPLMVPDMTEAEKLALSSVTLALSLEPEAAAAPGEIPSPFRFGALQVVQKGDPEFKPTDTLSFYYQVYNAKKDEAGAASLDIDYQYLAVQQAKEIALGSIHVGPTASQVQAYSLPLNRFPKGEYKLRITVTDRLAGLKTTQEAEFAVVP